MEIYTVKSGDSLYKIARRYGISAEKLAADNGLNDPDALSVGEALVIVQPSKSYTVREGDTLSSIASRFGSSVTSLWQYNPSLQGKDTLRVGETLTVRTATPIEKSIATGVRADGDTSESLLRAMLPYATFVAVNGGSVDTDGGIRVPVEANALRLASEYRTIPLLRLTNTGDGDGNPAEIAREILADEESIADFIETLSEALTESGYGGVELAFRDIPTSEVSRYIRMIDDTRTQLATRGLYTFASLPSTESARYNGIAQAADAVILATDEGEGFVPTRSDVESAIREGLLILPPQKLLFDIPLYGYDKIKATKEEAVMLPTEDAVAAAKEHRAAIIYDEEAALPYFTYYERNGSLPVEREVRFSDVRSVDAYLRLINENDLDGVFMLPLNRFYPPAFLALATQYYIQKPTVMR